MRSFAIDDHSQGIFSKNLGQFFPIFEKGQGRPPKTKVQTETGSDFPVYHQVLCPS